MDNRRIGLVLEQRHAEVHRNVLLENYKIIEEASKRHVESITCLETRDLVIARTAGEELAVLEEDDVLHGGPAEALDKGALDLTNVDGRTQRIAEVHHDVAPEDLYHP